LVESQSGDPDYYEKKALPTLKANFKSRKNEVLKEKKRIKKAEEKDKELLMEDSLA